MANGRVVENLQRFYRMAALGVSVFYVAIVLVLFTVVLIARRVLAEVKIPVNGPLERQAIVSSGARARMANEQR